MNQQTFEEWMNQIDKIIGSVAFGMQHNDLPDIAYYDLYENGVPPQEAAEEALIEAGAPEELITSL